jgi:hypothetical protein
VDVSGCGYGGYVGQFQLFVSVLEN